MAKCEGPNQETAICCDETSAAEPMWGQHDVAPGHWLCAREMVINPKCMQLNGATFQIKFPERGKKSSYGVIYPHEIARNVLKPENFKSTSRAGRRGINAAEKLARVIACDGQKEPESKNS